MIRSETVETFEGEYRLSLYEKIADLNHSKKSSVLLVQNSLTGRVYIKKELKNYNLDVYRALNKIQTMHIAQIYEIFEQDEMLIVIEEFVNGRTLEDILEEEGTLDEQSAIKYLIQLCEVLELLHQQTPPIIHRDIKPSNVMITNDGILKLIDFDVSRVYRQESEIDTHILGTKGYASPEQFGFEQTDGRSDIYSMGILLNVLTTGVNPKVNKANSQLKRIIEKCTKFSPEDRYQTVNELKIDLFEQLRGEKVETNSFKSTFNFQLPPELEKNLKHLVSVLTLTNKLTYGNLYRLIMRKEHVPKRPENKFLRELKQIPGYRSGNILYVPFATYWYLFLIYGGFFTTKEPDIYLLLENITMALTLFLMILVSANYKACHARLPLLKSNKWLGLINYNIGLLIVWGIVQQILIKLSS